MYSRAYSLVQVFLIAALGVRADEEGGGEHIYYGADMRFGMCLSRADRRVVRRGRRWQAFGVPRVCRVPRGSCVPCAAWQNAWVDVCVGMCIGMCLEKGA